MTKCKKMGHLTLFMLYLFLFMGLSGVHAADDSIKLGITLPMTGGMATYGKDLERSTILAIEEINATGGILGKKLEIIVADTSCDPQQAAMAASLLVSKGVVGVVGGFCSGATLPTMKIFGDAGIPYVISVANSSSLIPANPGNCFQSNGTSEHQAEAAVQLFTSLKAKKIALIHQGDGFSKSLAETTQMKWEKLGNTVVAVEMVTPGEQDQSSLVTTMRKSRPDFIYWTAYYGDGAAVIKQLRQGGVRSNICVADGSNSHKLIELAGKAAEGVYCTSNPLVELLPASKNFIETFTKKFDTPPGMCAGMQYDGLYLMADAIKRAGTPDGDAIKKALEQTKAFKGITAEIGFKKDNTLIKSNFVILQIKNAKWTMKE
jgi:branched-chain amino acid transport system substrate-binding protein